MPSHVVSPSFITHFTFSSPLSNNLSDKPIFTKLLSLSPRPKTTSRLLPHFLYQLYKNPSMDHLHQTPLSLPPSSPPTPSTQHHLPPTFPTASNLSLLLHRLPPSLSLPHEPPLPLPTRHLFQPLHRPPFSTIRRRAPSAVRPLFYKKILSI
ncbi:hypothetical protein LguiB_000880 [Lonicera macranthoides]